MMSLAVPLFTVAMT